MANLNENLEKIKNVAKDVAQKAQENETIANVAEKINQNEHVQKIKNSKNAKLIKIGAIALAVILVISLFSGGFGNKNVKKAEKQIVSEYTEILEDEGAGNIKIKTKLIAKNKAADLYCFDTTASCKYEGEKRKQSSFIVVYSDGKESYLVAQYEYQKENKSIKRELAFSALSRG